MNQIRTPGARRKTQIAKERIKAQKQKLERERRELERLERRLKIQHERLLQGQEQFEKEVELRIQLHKESRVEPKPRSWLGQLFWP